MAKRKAEVIWLKTARNNIADIAIWLETKGYPDTAEKFTQQLYNFGDSFAKMPKAFPLCKHPVLAKQGKHCASYKNWVFIHKFFNNHIVIYTVVHGKTLTW